MDFNDFLDVLKITPTEYNNTKQNPPKNAGICNQKPLNLIL